MLKGIWNRNEVDKEGYSDPEYIRAKAGILEDGVWHEPKT